MDKGNESGQNRAQTRTLSKSRAQNFNKKLGQGSTPSLPIPKCAPLNLRHHTADLQLFCDCA